MPALKKSIAHAIWTIYTDLGGSSAQSGDWRLSETMFRAALAEATRDKNMRNFHAVSIFNLGRMFHASGQLEEAREHYRQAYCASLRERAPNFDLILLVLGEMVQLHFDRQDYQRAKPLLKRMLQWARLGRAGQAQVGKIVLKLEFAQAQMRGGASDCGTTQKTTPIQLDHSAPIHSQL